MRPPHTAKRGPSIAEVGEHALVDRLTRRAGTPPDFVTIGIGDDAAVLSPERGMVEVVTTDTLVEDVHFRRDWTAPEATGHKALAVNLSDLAAMGAKPRASLLSLALPDHYPLDDFDALIDGFVALAHAVGAPLVGGNLTRSPGPVMIDATAIGVARPRRLLRRQGARAGDELYVTGHLGAAAAGLAMLEAGRRPTESEPDMAACVQRYERPDARVRCGSIVARTGSATAAIDLSDGLSDGARRLATAAGLGVILESAELPIHPGTRQWAGGARLDALAFALAGGDDYELLFAVSPRQRRKFLAAVKRARDVAVTRIGTFASADGHWLSRDGVLEPLPLGFVHF